MSKPMIFALATIVVATSWMVSTWLGFTVVAIVVGCLVVALTRSQAHGPHDPEDQL